MDEPKQLIPGLFRLRNRHVHCLRVDDMGVRGTKDETDEYSESRNFAYYFTLRIFVGQSERLWGRGPAKVDLS